MLRIIVRPVQRGQQEKGLKPLCLQKPDDPLVSLLRGQIPSSSPFLVLEGRPSPEEEEVLAELEIPPFGGDVKGGIPRFIGNVQGSTPVEEQPAALEIAGFGQQVQSRSPQFVRAIDIGSCREQKIEQFQLIHQGGMMDD